MKTAMILVFSVVAFGQAREGTAAPSCMPGDQLTIQNGNYVCVDTAAPLPKPLTHTVSVSPTVKRSLLPLPGGTKVYVEPMDGFEVFFMSAIANKHVPLAITLDKTQAEYVFTGNAESQNAGWAKILLTRDVRSSQEFSVLMSNMKGDVIWTCSAMKQSAIRGKRSAAEACAKLLNHIVVGGK